MINMPGCPRCGRMLEEEVSVCPYCNYNFKEISSYFNKDHTRKFLEDEKYAGLIKRIVAGLIDIYLTAIITYLIIYYLKIELIKSNILLISSIFTILYLIINTLMERTLLRGSIGKYLVGIKAVDKDENPETILIALCRNLAKILNILTVGIGLLLCAGTKKKQTLGDIVSKTYVITDLKITSKDNRLFSNPFKRLLAFIIDIILIAIILYGINFLFRYLINLDIEPNLKDLIKNIQPPLNIIIIFFYFPVIESQKGTTPGKKIMKIKTTTLKDQKPGFFRLLLKQIILIIEIITLGFLLSLVTPKRQTLSNRLTSTIVIDS